MRWRPGGLPLADAAAALVRLEAEQANLLAAVQQAASAPGVPSQLATQLAHALFGFFLVRSYWGDWARINHTALQVGDRPAQAHNDLGVAHERQGEYAEARDHFQHALIHFREVGDRHGQANSLTILGVVHQRMGRYPEALDHHRRALTLFRELGDRRGQVEALRDLGDALRGAGRPGQARQAWREALELCETLRIPEADEVRSRLADLPAE